MKATPLVLLVAVTAAKTPAVETDFSTPALSPTKMFPVNTSRTGLVSAEPAVTVTGQVAVISPGAALKTGVNLCSLPSFAPT